MAEATPQSPGLKQPHSLTPRVQWLRDYYFKGLKRAWNNEFAPFTTGTPWDVLYDEISYHIVPETYAFFEPFRASTHQVAHLVDLPKAFWSWTLVERRAWFIKEVMLNHLPQEILPGDLIAGGRFNLLASRCWSEEETRERDAMLYGPAGARAGVKWFHDHGYGNSGATSGHLIPDYARILQIGWSGVLQELEQRYQEMSPSEQNSAGGAQIRAMKTAASLAPELAKRYAALCRQLAQQEQDQQRQGELQQMAANLDRVPLSGATNFWEAIQALWITHMLVMSDECYPGPGVSFGRLDQYLWPYWKTSVEQGMDRGFAKEILQCFWVHANTAYDAMIRIGGNQGITAGFGQLFNLSGLGADGKDQTNDLTYLLLEVIDEMAPILEPKPNVRLHRNSPEELLDKVVGMVASSQGAPFLLNFDERSMAGMKREAKKAGLEHLIHDGNVHDYASVGCLENTMVGNDRSGTVDNNLNLLKAVELAMTGGKDLLPAVDAITGQQSAITQDGPETGSATQFKQWQEFWRAYQEQTRYLLTKCAELYEKTETMRAKFSPTPYLSCLVKGCAQKALDITQGGAEINLTTVEAVTFGTTVDSLLAIKNMVFEQKKCTMQELLQALTDNWQGHEKLQAWARFRSPKYGRDDDQADAMARDVMELWAEETWKHRTRSTGRQFRPGMLSWNYWVGDGYIMAASADGRPKGTFLSNAICPSNGADINGPTANANSVGKALGGLAVDGGDWQDYVNLLPNGASHTITFNPSHLRDPEHRSKFKAFLRGYCRNGGTALQINILDPDMLRQAQQNPQDFRHLLVRVTGYNAYFASIGRELQDEIIARESHQQM